MDQTMLTVVILAIFLIVFAAMWFGITTLLVRLSGWKSLQSAFPDANDTSIKRMFWRTGAVGRGPITGITFRNALNLEVCASGLRVSITKLIAPGASPIFIPWTKIETKERRMLAYDYWDLHLESDDELRLMLREKTGKALAEASRGSLKPPS